LAYQFGGFVLDPGRRELRSGAKVCPVEPQVFDILEFLIRNRDRVVSRDDLLAGVWNGRIVSDSAIAARINAVRQAIGDDGREQRFIRTIPRKGFRFVGDVWEEGEEAKARVVPARQALGAAGDQRISFCRTVDGVSLAVARVGRGKPLVCIPTWGHHIEHDWENPLRAQFWQFLAERFELIRYDGRGFGLSDRDVEVSPATCERDLEAVVDALGLRRYALLAISVGTPTAIAHAASYPERVSKLAVHEAFVQGMNRRRQMAVTGLLHTYGAIMGTAWPVILPIIRTNLADQFPGLTAEQIKWIADLLPKTTSLENAVRYFFDHADIDVTDRLPQVRVPTLVLHCRDCRPMFFDQALWIAKSVPGARLVNIESPNLIPLPGEAAWPVFLETIEDFLTEP
jgi:DNA-binding winged helix-turn-helix (wHTH) protein/pimeloyl-ACP methyl ester carboxylesterase